MGASLSNVAGIQQDFLTNVTQTGQQSCVAAASNVQSNNVIIVTGVKVGGDFAGLSSQLQTDATCTIVSSMDNQVTNILKSSLQQSNQTQSDWFNGFSWDTLNNTFNIRQSVTNNISQINQALCSANTVQSQSGNYLYLSNAEIGGNFVGFTSSSNAQASCSMTNYMKNTTYNQATANGSQTNAVTGIFAIILGVIAFVVGLSIIASIIIFSVGAVSYVGRRGTEATAQQKQDAQDLALANALGITPDEAAAAGL